MNRRGSGELLILLIVLVVSIVGIFFFRSIKPSTDAVTIYVAHDQDYSEPILKDFEDETGIKVNAVYDTEASKSVGLVNRLIAEKDNPQADIFWNNEVSRTIQLKKEGVLESYKTPNFDKLASVYKDANGFWTGFAARARVVLVNTDLLTEAQYPDSLYDLTNARFKDKVTIADPRAGSTGSHVAALYTVLGQADAEQYLSDLKANGLNIAQSNGQTMEKVSNGEMVVGFTDTDDANEALSDGKPVKVVYPDQGEGGMGTLVIPNTLMMIKGAKNVDAAHKLFDYLISEKTEAALAATKSVQMPLLPGVDRPANVPDVSTIKPMQVNWETISENLAPSLDFVEKELIQ
ncbi:extracellular solute-binding protein [candidate division WWE3 bacterium]|nr:extracellular solute-binding protein [candidate division WWE3 bacterium]